MGREVAVEVVNANESMPPLLDLQTVTQEVNWEVGKLTEFEILRRLSHQNIIRQFDFQQDKDFIYIPMDLCDKNLEEYCRQSHNVISVPKRLKILELIGKGIEYMHNLKKPIVHGDLNPRNILIIYGNINNVIAKITDFKTSVEEKSIFVPISSEDKYYIYSQLPEACRVIPASSNTGQSGDAVEVTPVSSDTRQSGDVEVISVSSNTRQSGDTVEVTPVSSNTRQSGDAVEVTPVSTNAGQSGQAVRVIRKGDIYAYGCLIHTILTKDPTNMHPYGDMIDNSLVIKGTRKHSLKDERETDLFLLADLAIDDATVEDSSNRPCITTLLNHPMYWNMADKELFITRIAEDYRIAQGLADNDKKFQKD